jgi:hypothetical protein
MKNNYLFFNVAIALVIGVLFLLPERSNVLEGKYIPRKQETAYSTGGAFEYWTSVKANPKTGKINRKDVENAFAKAEQMPSAALKSSQGWEFQGPNNMGGRTRAFLIDKDNPNVMFVASVSGGLWKSTVGGQYWEEVEYGAKDSKFPTLPISSITQDKDGNLYLGTGENFWNTIEPKDEHGSEGSNASGKYIFKGAGIYKVENPTSPDPKISLLSSTWNDSFTDEQKEAWTYIYKVSYDETSNLLWAATSGGLKYSKDQGKSWEGIKADVPLNDTIFYVQKAKMIIKGKDTTYTYSYVYTKLPRLSEIDTIKSFEPILGEATNVEVSSNGTVAAVIGRSIFVKKADESVFVQRTGTVESLIPRRKVGRIELAFAPSDPDYIYASASDFKNTVYGVFKSIDAGSTWGNIAQGGSASFQPFGTQGDYNMAISVDPNNKNKVYVAGLDFWLGNKGNTEFAYSWTQVSSWSLPSTSKLYCHPDIHSITFHPTKNTIYLTTDGGVTRCSLGGSSGYFFQEMNKNYGSLQVYGLGVNSYGYVLAGTQDNGTFLLNPNIKNSSYGFKILSGDGGNAALSNITPYLAFGTKQYGYIGRNNLPSFSLFKEFSSEQFNLEHWGTKKSWYEISDNGNHEAKFLTPFDYWETTDNSDYFVETAELECLKKYNKYLTDKNGNVVLKDGKKIPLVHAIPSQHIYNAPVFMELDSTMEMNEILKYKDPYYSLMAVGMQDAVWVSRSASSYADPNIDRDDWWKVTPKQYFDSERRADVTAVRFSNDANHLFFATEDGRIYRVSNLRNCINKYHAFHDYAFGDYPDSLRTEIDLMGRTTRVITNLETDPKNVDNLLVTLGSFGEESYVYLCQNATTASIDPISNKTDDPTYDFSHFINISANLNFAPAYCALFEANSNHILVGTELGVYMTDLDAAQSSSTIADKIEWNAMNSGIGPVTVTDIDQTLSKGAYIEYLDESKYTLDSISEAGINCYTRKSDGKAIFIEHDALPENVDTYGAVYISTFGKGVYKLNDYVKQKKGSTNDNAPIVNNSEENFTIYPNPINTEFSIDFVSNEETTVEMNIYSIAGKLMYQMNNISAVEGNNTIEDINIADLNSGLYILQIKVGNKSMSQRIIKQ